MAGLVVVLVTAPSGKGAEIARVLVEERLAACVNIVGGVRSLYRWQGRVEDDREDLLVIKTKRCLLGRLEERIRSVHPYTVPEIVALEPVHVLRDYECWAAGETAPC